MFQKHSTSEIGHGRSNSFIFGASIALNFAFIVLWASSSQFNDFTGAVSVLLGTATLNGDRPVREWTRPAVTESQIAASFNCSGHGSVYAEMLVDIDGANGAKEVLCECDQCFTGSFCQHRVPDCRVEVDGGDPLVFKPYWRKNPEAGVVIPAWYRMGYEFHNTVITALENEIRAMHKLVGNAATEGRYIVIGVGETQIAMSAFAAFSIDTQGKPLNVVSDPPYYDAFKRQIETVKPGSAVWGVPSDLKNNGAILEMVISPNNPDGSIRHKVVNDPKAYTIYDHAYYWPHYTPITEPANEDFMMFTLSKLTGHAGSRLGWALIKDEVVYMKMLTCLRLNSVKVPHETQLRAVQLLRSIREGYTKYGQPKLGKLPMEYAAQQHIFHYGHSKLKERWDRMIQLFQGSERFKLDQDFKSKHCQFLKDSVRANPAFAWIYCLREEDTSCVTIFEEAGIYGRGGARCGKTDKHVRLAMMSDDSAFENLFEHLQELLSKSVI